jgi:hypothetical protein
MKKLLLIIIFIFSISPLHAEWKPIIQLENLSQYIETNSIKPKGKIVSYWMLEDHTSLQDGSWLSMKYKSENNCETEEFRHISLNYYSENMGNGKAVSNINNISPWSHVVPGTTGEYIHKFVCKKR